MTSDPAERDDSLADLGEDGIIAAVTAQYASSPSVIIGPGDDAAVLTVPGRVVVSTDTVVEGLDFRQDWSSAHDVGVKVAAQNFADVAAMGALPMALVVSLAAPDDLPAAWAQGLAAGIEDECRRAGAAVVGGDMSGAGQIVVTGTALGSLTGDAVRRDGARPGDVVALAGATGPSGAGLDLLLAELPVPRDRPDQEVVARLLAAHRSPRPGYRAGPQAAAAGATAMIDTSDGLLRDAARVAVASGVVVDVATGLLGVGPDLLAAQRLLARDGAARRWALTGGEDHALLACFPPDAALPPSFRVIGVVRAASAGEAPGVLVDGAPWAGSPGWTHFPPAR